MPSDGSLLAVFDTGDAQSLSAEDGVQLAPRSTAVWALQ
jgi:hypothetical protein